MKSEVASAIAAVIRRSKESRADDTLRAVLKESGLGPEQKREVSEKIFAFYRWHDWVTQEQSLQRAVEQAWQLASDFAKNPAAFSDELILAKAFPSWLAEESSIPVESLRQMQAPAPLWIRTRAEKEEAVRQELPLLQAGPFPQSWRYSGSADLFRSASFKEGRLEIQDIASQAVGWMARPQPKQSWWDACAGEGGKALHWSELMKNQGLVWCSDRSQRRLRLLKERAARAGVFNYRLARWEGTLPLPWKNKYDGILVDAPCTGSGTWQRNPQARWTLRREEMAELATVQLRLLELVSKALKPGGKLVYSVCTLARGETEGVVEQFAAKNPGLKPAPWKHPVTGEEKAAQFIWPHQMNGNGMFIAVWEA